jgi:starvation-inducible DNA-binding protein
MSVTAHLPVLEYSVDGVVGQQAERLVAGLNQTLANLTDMALDYKQAHWNVVGLDFSQLHELFDTFADQARDYADLVAERATTLGGAARGTLEATAAQTQLPPFPEDERDERKLLVHLVACLRLVDQQLREQLVATSGELATQDVYIEIARGIEKQRWMLQAHLR